MRSKLRKGPMNEVTPGEALQDQKRVLTPDQNRSKGDASIISSF